MQVPTKNADLSCGSAGFLGGVCSCAVRLLATEPLLSLTKLSQGSDGTFDTLLLDLCLTASCRFRGNTASVDNLVMFKSALLPSSGELKGGTVCSCLPLVGSLAAVLVALGGGRLCSPVRWPLSAVGRGGAFAFWSMGSSSYRELSINSNADGWAIGDIGRERSCVLQGPFPASFPALVPLKSKFCRYGIRQGASSKHAQEKQSLLTCHTCLSVKLHILSHHLYSPLIL